jgi:hypothetical protein
MRCSWSRRWCAGEPLLLGFFTDYSSSWDYHSRIEDRKTSDKSKNRTLLGGPFEELGYVLRAQLRVRGAQLIIESRGWYQQSII